MIRWLTLGVVATALLAVLPAQAGETDATSPTPQQLSAPAETNALPAAPPALESPSAAPDATAEALRKRLASLDQGNNDEEQSEGDGTLPEGATDAQKKAGFFNRFFGGKKK